nr:hypothetical protein [Tanacetum cinerariifolium]
MEQYAGQNAGHLNGYNAVQNVGKQMIGGNGGNQFRQYAGNLNGYNKVQNVGNQNQIGNGNLVAARAEGNAARQYGNQIRCYNCKGFGHYARNCTAMPRRKDAATPVYDSDGSAEVHENCDNNEIFNMFTQEEQYTELLEPIPEPQQVPQNDNNVISENLAVEVEKVNSVNRKLKETNADLTTELA